MTTGKMQSKNYSKVTCAVAGIQCELLQLERQLQKIQVFLQSAEFYK